MIGIIEYYDIDPDFVNSVEGWVVKSLDDRFESYFLCEESDRVVRDKHRKGLIKPGDEVEYELITDCYVDRERNVVMHSTKSKIIFEKENKQKLFLIDIDGTICDDIKNEDSHLYPTAGIYPEALKIINKWYDEGNVITFFTARESKDREVTLQWLDKHGFKYHGLVMDKPRINDQQEYVWIDNKKVRAITYLGTWSDLKEVDAKIQIFG
jgi:hypothetical protein